MNSLIEIGKFCHERGWVPATSGNFSIRLENACLLMTASGVHKGELTAESLILVDPNGQTTASTKTPSAETQLHCGIYRLFPDTGAVYHTHSLTSVYLTHQFQAEIVYENMEILKAFSGINTHESRITVPIFENDQDMLRLQKQVTTYYQNQKNNQGFCYLIRGHGLYTWGENAAIAKRHLEAIEYLFQYTLISRRNEI